MSAAAGEDILGWLNGAIGARENQANAAAESSGGRNWSYRAGYVVAGPEGDQVATGTQDFLAPEAGEMVAANDPESVLRRCAADRKILDKLRDLSQLRAAPGQPIGIVEQMALDAIRSTLQLLAEGYGWTGGNR